MLRLNNPRLTIARLLSAIVLAGAMGVGGWTALGPASASPLAAPDGGSGAGPSGVIAPKPLAVPDLAITNAASPATVFPGQVLAFNQTLTNVAPDFAQNVTLTEAVPANTTFVSSTIPIGWTCTNPTIGGTGTLTCTKTSVGANETNNFAMVVQVSPLATSGTTLTHTATVATTTAETVTTNNTAIALATVSGATPTATTGPAPSLQLGITQSPTGSVPSGTTVSYTMTVTNTSASTASNLQVIALFNNSGPTYIYTTPPAPVNGTFSASNTGGILSVASLATNQTASVTFTGIASGNGTINLQGSIVGTQTTANQTTIVGTGGTGTGTGLTILKTASPTGAVPANSSVTYTVTVTNNTGGTQSGILVTDIFTFTNGASYSGAQNPVPSAGTWQPLLLGNPFAVGASGTWTIPTLNNGSSATLTFTGIATVGGYAPYGTPSYSSLALPLITNSATILSSGATSAVTTSITGASVGVPNYPIVPQPQPYQPYPVNSLGGCCPGGGGYPVGGLGGGYPVGGLGGGCCPSNAPVPLMPQQQAQPLVATPTPAPVVITPTAVRTVAPTPPPAPTAAPPAPAAQAAPTRPPAPTAAPPAPAAPPAEAPPAPTETPVPAPPPPPAPAAPPAPTATAARPPAPPPPAPPPAQRPPMPVKQLPATGEAGLPVEPEWLLLGALGLAALFAGQRLRR